MQLRGLFSHIFHARRRASVWDSAVIYQIYPRSFAEKRRPGMVERGEGSLFGIVSKLGYLKDLGVDVIWLSPFFPSPMKDGGYDVSDYTDVDQRYGDLNDFDELIAAARLRGIKVMIDFVPNHTSDQHPWFMESRQSRDNPKSDWYIWRDALPGGAPPNNWASVFSLPQLEKRRNGELYVEPGQPTPPVSAWQWDEARQQYYLHTFATEQPDLNWSNPEVRQALTDVMRFWLNRGVDGFRIDAVNHVAKDMSLANEEANPGYRDGIDNPYDQLQRHHSANFSEVLYDYLAVMTNVLDEPAYYRRDLYIVFETYVPQDMLDRINAISPGRAAAFNFTRIAADWEAPTHKQLIDHYIEHLAPDVIANHVNGNHDNPRLASRIGDQQARAAALVNATLPGQMYIYNGEEAGFHNVNVPVELRDDVLGLRDAERTPMAWNSEDGAGFSKAKRLWLPLAADFRHHSIATERADPLSSLWLYKNLLALRRSTVLRYGDYLPLVANQPVVLAYARRYRGDVLVVVVNFAPHEVTYRVENMPLLHGVIVLSTTRVIDASEPVLDFVNDLYISPYEAIIIAPEHHQKKAHH